MLPAALTDLFESVTDAQNFLLRPATYFLKIFGDVLAGAERLSTTDFSITMFCLKQREDILSNLLGEMETECAMVRCWSHLVQGVDKITTQGGEKEDIPIPIPSLSLVM